MNSKIDGCACSCGCGQETEEQKYEKLRQVIDEYKSREGSLIQVLHLAQGIFGYLPKELLRFISKEMKVPMTEVYGVVTFYSLFTTRPKGKNTIRVCMGTACYVRGAKDILEGFTKELGVKVGETTQDSKFTLEVTRCIGACSLAPAITINDKVYQKVDVQRLRQIIDEY
jgi:NADH:ubiquinone oxidoreductase subunit E